MDDYALRTELDGSPLAPPEEGQASIYVDVKDMAALRDALRGAGYDLETSLASVPKVLARPCHRVGSTRSRHRPPFPAFIPVAGGRGAAGRRGL